MPLLAFWKSNRSEVLKMTIEQMVSRDGDGTVIMDGNAILSCMRLVCKCNGAKVNHPNSSMHTSEATLFGAAIAPRALCARPRHYWTRTRNQRKPTSEMPLPATFAAAPLIGGIL